MKSIRIGMVLALVGAALAFAGGTQDASSYVIKLAYTPSTANPQESPDVMYGKVFKEYVEANAGGKLKVDIYAGGQLGSAAEMVQGVSSGAIEMAVINVNMLNNIYKPTMVLAVPGIFASVEECNAVLNGPWGASLFEGVRKASKIKVLDTGSNGFRNFTNNIREIKEMSDAKGVTFRVMESPVSIKMVEAMGARAVPMPGSEMYMAMKTKVVDGQENPVLNIIQDKTYEVQKYLTLDGHMASVMTYIINDDLFAKLPQDLQKVVVAGSRKGAEAANAVIKTRNEAGVEFLKQQGMVITQPAPEALRAWHKVIFDATQSYVREQIGNETVDTLLWAIADQRK
jgi:C4-dicarboxylate-binding protein DctP